MNLKKSFLIHCENNQYEINKSQVETVIDNHLKDYYVDNFHTKIF